MFGFKGKYGFSFSWKRLFGISGLRSRIAHKTGIPTSKSGMERKIGRKIIRFFFGGNGNN